MTPDKRLPPRGTGRQSEGHRETSAKRSAPVRHDLASFALGLAGAGLPVLALLPHDKRPRFAGSFHHATTDPRWIDEHWYWHPDDNIGVRPPPGLAVVDIDPRHGGDLTLSRLTAEHGPLPETWTAATGSDGRHFWFRVGGDLLEPRGSLGKGVDIKHGGTGFVVAPPSIHPNGCRYEWLTPPVDDPAPTPDWLSELMRRPVFTPVTSAAVVATDGRNGQFSLQCLVRRIECATEGERNRTVYGAMRDAFKQGDLDAWEDVLGYAALTKGLPDTEVRGIIRNARGGPR